MTGKGLSGGLYPIAATLLSARAGAWLEDDGWSNISTFGGSELGCRVAQRSWPSPPGRRPRRGSTSLTATFAIGLADLAARHPEWLVEVRQTGLVIGLRFAHPMGGMLMTRACYDTGIWAMFAGFDRSALQLKPGLLMSDAEAGEVLMRLRGRDQRAARERPPRGPRPRHPHVQPGRPRPTTAVRHRPGVELG